MSGYIWARTDTTCPLVQEVSGPMFYLQQVHTFHTVLTAATNMKVTAPGSPYDMWVTWNPTVTVGTATAPLTATFEPVVCCCGRGEWRWNVGVMLWLQPPTNDYYLVGQTNVQGDFLANTTKPSNIVWSYTLEQTAGSVPATTGTAYTGQTEQELSDVTVKFGGRWLLAQVLCGAALFVRIL